MKPFSIVMHFDVIEDQLLGIDSGDEPFAMNSLNLEAVIPAFHSGVIITVAFFAHAANQLMFGQQVLVNG